MRNKEFKFESNHYLLSTQEHTLNPPTPSFVGQSVTKHAELEEVKANYDETGLSEDNYGGSGRASLAEQIHQTIYEQPTKEKGQDGLAPNFGFGFQSPQLLSWLVNKVGLGKSSI